MKLKLLLLLLTLIIGVVSIKCVETKSKITAPYSFEIKESSSLVITNTTILDNRGTKEVLIRGAFSHLMSTPATKETTIIEIVEVNDLVLLWNGERRELHQEKVISKNVKERDI